MSASPPASTFEPTGPDIVHERFDDEVVVVDLGSGRYFSLDPVGGDVWELLRAGVTLADAADVLATRYAADHTAVAPVVSAFADQLVQAELFRATTAAGAAAASVDLSGPPAALFGTPRLETYTDMQDLLLLDPVHDVDASGWPAPAPDTPSR